MSFNHASNLESQPPRPQHFHRSSDPAYSDDPEFLSLANSLTEQLATLNSNISQLSRQISLIGTKRETDRVRERISTIIDESSAGFKDVGEGLKKVATWPDLNPHQKFTQGKLNTDFRASLGEFQVLQRTALGKQREAREALEAAGGGGGGGAAGAGEAEEEEEGTRLIQTQQMAAAPPRLAEQGEVDFQQSLIIERESEIRQIEQSVGELNELFRDVATMVHSQGDMLDTISGNVERTRDDTRGADVELRQASRYQRSARSKACCLLLIVAVILVVVILAVVLG